MEVVRISMSSTTFPPIPLDTIKAAQAVFGSSNYYLVIGDQVNMLFDGICLHSTPNLTQKQVHKLAVLYLITFFQHLETLPDQLAVDALRERVDWKYALHLPLKPAPFEGSQLCDFRAMVYADPASKQNLQKLLLNLTEIPQTAPYQCIQHDPNEVITHVCRISRLAKIWDAFNNTLEALATRHPDWLLTHSLPYWYERYGHTRRNLNLRIEPLEQDNLAQAVGGDGFYLLDAITTSEMQALVELPEVYRLRKVWTEQFERETGKIIWKKEACTGCSYSNRLRAAAIDSYHAQKGGGNK